MLLLNFQLGCEGNGGYATLPMKMLGITCDIVSNLGQNLYM